MSAAADLEEEVRWWVVSTVEMALRPRTFLCAGKSSRRQVRDVMGRHWRRDVRRAPGLCSLAELTGSSWCLWACCPWIQIQRRPYRSMYHSTLHDGLGKERNSKQDRAKALQVPPMLVADRPASVGWLRTSVVRAAGEGKGVGVGGEGEESFARSAGSNLTTWVGGDPGERNEGVDAASSLDRPRGRVLCFAPEVAHGTNVPCPACVQVSVL